MYTWLSRFSHLLVPLRPFTAVLLALSWDVALYKHLSAFFSSDYIRDLFVRHIKVIAGQVTGLFFPSASK